MPQPKQGNTNIATNTRTNNVLTNDRDSCADSSKQFQRKNNVYNKTSASSSDINSGCNSHSNHNRS